jgi:hypothetical protein
MPPSTALKSKPDENDVTLIDYNGAIQQLIAQSKKELEDIKNQILLENVNSVKLKEKFLKDTQEFERWKRSEEQKFKNLLAEKTNEIIKNKNEIDIHVQQQRQITADLNLQHQKFEGLNAERVKLKEELVRVEGMRIQAIDMIKQAETQRAEVLTQQNNANMALIKAKEIEEIAHQENIRLTNLNDALESRAREIEQKAKDLGNLKEFVEPKLRTITEQQEALEEAKKENDERIAQLQAKIEEEKILFKSVMDKKSEVEKQEKELLSKKEEFGRQQLLAGK